MKKQFFLLCEGVYVSCKRRCKAGFYYSFFIQLFNVKIIFETVVFVGFRTESLF